MSANASGRGWVWPARLAQKLSPDYQIWRSWRVDGDARQGQALGIPWPFWASGPQPGTRLLAPGETPGSPAGSLRSSNTVWACLGDAQEPQSPRRGTFRENFANQDFAFWESQPVMSPAMSSRVNCTSAPYCWAAF